MNTKMYVGNIPFSATESDLRDMFSAYGVVTDVFLPMDRDSGRPRGFAFVSMDTPESMTAAINGLNNKEMGGRTLSINEARPKEERPSYGGGGGGGGGYKGGGGGGGGYKGGGGGGGYKGGGGGGGGHKGGGKGWDRGDRGGDRW